MPNKKYNLRYLPLFYEDLDEKKKLPRRIGRFQKYPIRQGSYL